MKILKTSLRSFRLGCWKRNKRSCIFISFSSIPRKAEPIEPKGTIGFSLYSTACRDVGGVDDMSVRDRYSFPQRQTEIPTDLFSEVVGIVILCVFVVDLDLIVEQDDLVHEGVDQQS